MISLQPKTVLGMDMDLKPAITPVKKLRNYFAPRLTSDYRLTASNPKALASGPIAWPVTQHAEKKRRPDVIVTVGGVAKSGESEVMGRLVEAFLLDDNEWREMTRLPVARNHHVAHFLNGYVYVVGELKTIRSTASLIYTWMSCTTVRRKGLHNTRRLLLFGVSTDDFSIYHLKIQVNSNVNFQLEHTRTVLSSFKLCIPNVAFLHLLPSSTRNVKGLTKKQKYKFYQQKKKPHGPKCPGQHNLSKQYSVITLFNEPWYVMTSSRCRVEGKTMMH